MRSWLSRGDRLDQAFKVAIILKGLDGVLEVLGGLLLLVISPETINRIVGWLTEHELSQDPHDFIARHLLNAASGLTRSSVLFGSVYLLLHGVVKIVLVIALLKDKLWAYPWMIGFLLVFIVYQAYRLIVGPSVGLAALTLFDLVVVWLTYREYRRHRSRPVAIPGAVSEA